MDWHEYEKIVFENITDCFPDAECIFNSKVLGKYSKGYRQCDAIIKQTVNGKEHTILVDAKYYSKRIDVKCVEEFISMSNDIGASEGILVTPLGYSQLAYERAENDPSQILLDILNLEELKHFQGYGAIPYADENGVILTPAFGWIIDAASRLGCLAFSYRKGFDFDKAFKEKEFIYFNIWNKYEDEITKIELLENQTELLKETSDVIESKIEIIVENGKELALRKTIIKDYISPEYACAVEYEGFIFFGVMLSENNRESVNLAKLIHMISKTVPIGITYADKTNP